MTGQVLCSTYVRSQLAVVSACTSCSCEHTSLSRYPPPRPSPRCLLPQHLRPSFSTSHPSSIILLNLCFISHHLTRTAVSSSPTPASSTLTSILLRYAHCPLERLTLRYQVLQQRRSRPEHTNSNRPCEPNSTFTLPHILTATHHPSTPLPSWST